MCRLSLVGVSVGCSLLRLSSLWITGSRCTGLAAHGMWDLPGPGFEPVCPALAGGFSTTDPAGKSLILFYVVLLLLVRGQRLTFPVLCPNPFLCTSLILLDHRGVGAIPPPQMIVHTSSPFLVLGLA